MDTLKLLSEALKLADTGHPVLAQIDARLDAFIATQAVAVDAPLTVPEEVAAELVKIALQFIPAGSLAAQVLTAEPLIAGAIVEVAALFAKLTAPVTGSAGQKCGPDGLPLVAGNA